MVDDVFVAVSRARRRQAVLCLVCTAYLAGLAACLLQALSLVAETRWAGLIVGAAAVGVLVSALTIWAIDAVLLRRHTSAPVVA